MLHVILQILAIIGIVLLCIVGLLLLVILLVLFVPVRYRIRGSKNSENIHAVAKATYLLHLITVKCTYEKDLQIVARVLGFKVFDLAKKTESETEEENAAVESAQDPATASPKEREYKQEQSAEPLHTEKNSDLQEKPVLQDEPDTQEKPQNSKESLFTKIKNKILAIIEKIKYTITSIYDKIKNITETVSYYKNVFDNKENRALFARVWERVCKVLKSIRPRKLHADLHIGTGSPDTTGYVCALYGMLIPVLGKHVLLNPDFEEKVFEGEFFAKGKITVFTILIQALKIIFDKQLRIFIKQLKREENINGRKSV